ncbi:MAG: hypothetical protein R3D05_00615 [Dongiaceae bacterium]
MNEPTHGFTVRRVVIALESGCENLQALETAAELAARARAELHGIFVDDIRLLQIAALPFTRQASLHSAASLPFEPADVEAQLRALARRARRCLEDVATRLRVPWSFETVRGDRASVIAATQGTDVLVVETTTRPFGQYLKMSTEWSEIAITCERACLLTSAAGAKRKGILAVYDGSEGGEHAVAAALALDGTRNSSLTIASTAPAAAETTLRQQLREGDTSAEVRTIKTLTLPELARVMADANCGLLILPVELVTRHRAELETLLAAPTCAVLLVN